MKRHWQNNNKAHSSRENTGELVQGKIQHHGRFAFLLSEKEDGHDVFLHGRGLALAMDGDRVEARVRREADGRYSGEIVRVLNHANNVLVGVLKQFPHGWAVFPEKGNALAAQVTGFANKIAPKAGSLVVLEISRWPTETTGSAGIVIEQLGDPDDLRTRISSMLRARGIIEHFPADVLAQSESFGTRLEPHQWQGREELFDLPVVTIDGADAKDFDDAVSIETFDGFSRLGVHIADVSYYVKPGTDLDKEAYLRGTSVYLPDRVVPMLPPSLSNNLCSLVPNQERLTVSVFMDVNSAGEVIRRRMAVTVIRSCKRFTYEEVQTLLDGQSVRSVTAPVAEAVLRMGALAKVLHRNRAGRGSLDFDLPEYKVETNTDGKPLRVSLRARIESHRLIEEFMLLANEAIATELLAAKAPFLHRRHDEPDTAKIKTLAKTLGELGFTAGHLMGGNTRKAIQDILRQAENNPLSEHCKFTYSAQHETGRILA